MAYGTIRTILKHYPGKYSQLERKWLPLFLHAQDTASIMAKLVDNWLPGRVQNTIAYKIDFESMKKLAIFLGLIHDLGKLTPIFAARITGKHSELAERLSALGLHINPLSAFDTPGKTPHAKAGEAIFLHIAQGRNREIASIIGSHHGKPQEEDLKDYLNTYPQHFFGVGEMENSEQGRLWYSLGNEWLSFCLSKAGYASLEDLPAIDLPAQILLTGLLIMADWIASNTDYFPLLNLEDDVDEQDLETRFKRGWNAAGLPLPWYSEGCITDIDVFSKRFGFSPSPIQEQTMDVAQSMIKPGIMIVEAPMGCGKTEAALAATELLAQKLSCGGIFFGLPTQATANGIFERIKAWADQQAYDTMHTIRLAHGMAAFNDDFNSLAHGTAYTDTDEPVEGLTVHPWFQGRKRVMLDQFVIGTVDQLLMASLKQKHMMLRHLGLAGKVVIIDECHAYDAYMNVYLEQTLKWLGAYGVPVILLSATLPCTRRTALVHAYLNRKLGKEQETWTDSRVYPLITFTNGWDVQSRAVQMNQEKKNITICSLTDGDICTTLSSKLAQGGCAGVILNTVARAQNAADELKRAGFNVLLIHAHFIATDRAKWEELILNKVGKKSTQKDRDKLVVVGTQVLEQSLDIDFDVLITDLCPMDLLLQRIGRLHRHNRTRPEGLRNARCYVVGASERELEEGSRAIYGAWLLLRTRAMLPEHITLPNQIPDLVQDTYAEADDDLLQDSELRKAYEKYKLLICGKETRARTFLLKDPPIQTRRTKTMTGLLNTNASDSEAQGEACVRDGAFSVQVLVMMRHENGDVGFLPWICDGNCVSASHVPSNEDAKKIAKQRLTLPHVFCVGENGEQVVRELERRNREELAEWQKSSWLKGELILLLDKKLRCSLLNYELWYAYESGLRYERRRDENAENGSKI